VFDKETRRKPPMSAADAVICVWNFNRRKMASGVLQGPGLG
jgi:hypothetical protein